MMAPRHSLTETPFIIHPATRLGHVHYTVSDLDRQVAFYQNVLGFKLHWREGTTAGLGAGSEDLLRLTEARGAARVRGTTGAYHFGLLFPNRQELARAIARLNALRYPNYPADHIVAKTTWLNDPEGNNIELYIESPEDGTFGVVNDDLLIRRTNGAPSDGREPLDGRALFRELSPGDRLDDPLPKGTKIGHIHLYEADIHDSMYFYHDVLGFEVAGLMPKSRTGDVSLNGQQALTIAFNTWLGEGAPPPPPNSLGLRYFTIVLPDTNELERVIQRSQQAGIATERTENGILVRDPSQIAVVLTAPTKP